MQSYGTKSLKALYSDHWHHVVSRRRAYFTYIRMEGFEYFKGESPRFTTDLWWLDIENLKLHFLTSVWFFHKNDW
jgi:hypothetical protein